MPLPHALPSVLPQTHFLSQLLKMTIKWHIAAKWNRGGWEFSISVIKVKTEILDGSQVKHVHLMLVLKLPISKSEAYSSQMNQIEHCRNETLRQKWRHWKDTMREGDAVWNKGNLTKNRSCCHNYAVETGRHWKLGSQKRKQHLATGKQGRLGQRSHLVFIKKYDESLFL